jgi:prepilin-type N-terminal cleavage/methylation domain-containing protein/prepilin-type processing-associated H-X9-DG protein
MMPYSGASRLNSQFKKAFTLVEILVVLGILALLAAILLPAFATVRGRARQTSCLSNLKQIGVGVGMYMQDSDGRFPRAVDPIDHAYPAVWSDYPDFSKDIASFPMINVALQPYLKSTQLFSCPADTGFTQSDFDDVPLDATPTSFEKFGTSYYYRTELAALNKGELAVQNLAGVNLFFDGKGIWHGTWIPVAKRYNCLFADFHVKNINSQAMDEAWRVPVGG